MPHEWVRRVSAMFTALCEVARQTGVDRNGLAVLAVEEVAHRASPSLVRFHQRLAFVGVHAHFRFGIRGFGNTAGWAAVGKAGFVRFELEFL